MTTNKFYRLDGKNPVPCSSLEEWASHFESSNRRVAQTVIGKVHVSTVFLGVNHRYGEGAPLLFESMIFGGKHDQEQERYSTWEDAEIGHKRFVSLVKGELN